MSLRSRLPSRPRLRWEARDAVRRLRVRPSGGAPAAGGPRLLVLSPHLDDAVLSCGRLLAGCPGAVVVSVFTGGLPARDEVTSWDRTCGFRPGDDVMAARKAEDVRALERLGAEARWCDLTELQYGEVVPAAAVEAAVAAAVDAFGGGDAVVAPLGLEHADHRALGRAAVAVARRRPDLAWFAYEDLPYRDHVPGALDARLAELAAEGVVATCERPGPAGDPAAKLAALRRYRSQVRGLGDWMEPALGEERYHRLVVPPAS